MDATLSAGERPLLVVRDWLGRFNAALASGDGAGLAGLFDADGHWRDIAALTWRIATVSGAGAVAEGLLAAARGQGARDFAVDAGREPPRLVERAGEMTIEAILRFETRAGRGAGGAAAAGGGGGAGLDADDVARPHRGA